MVVKGNGRIHGAPDQKQAFLDWCHDHGGDPNYEEQHKRSVGPGQRVDLHATCDLDKKTVTMEWKPSGKTVTIDDDRDSGTQQYQFSHFNPHVGRLEVSLKNTLDATAPAPESRTVRISAPMQPPDDRIARYDLNNREPEHGWVRDWTP